MAVKSKKRKFQKKKTLKVYRGGKIPQVGGQKVAKVIHGPNSQKFHGPNTPKKPSNSVKGKNGYFNTAGIFVKFNNLRANDLGSRSQPNLASTPNKEAVLGTASKNKITPGTTLSTGNKNYENIYHMIQNVVKNTNPINTSGNYSIWEPRNQPNPYKLLTSPPGETKTNSSYEPMKLVLRGPVEKYSTSSTNTKSTYSTIPTASELYGSTSPQLSKRSYSLSAINNGRYMLMTPRQKEIYAVNPVNSVNPLYNEISEVFYPPES